MDQLVRLDRPFAAGPGTAYFTCAFRTEALGPDGVARASAETLEHGTRHYVELFPIARTEAHVLCEGFAWVPPGADELALHLGTDGPAPPSAREVGLVESAALLRRFESAALRVVDRAEESVVLPLAAHRVRDVDTLPGARLAVRRRWVLDLGRFAWMNVFVTAHAGAGVLRVDLDWSNAAFPGPGDVHFRELVLETDLRVASLLGDPVMDPERRVLVRAGEHRLAQRRQRPLRFLLSDAGLADGRLEAALDLEGWGTGDWFEYGGLFATGVGAPRVTPRATREVEREATRALEDFRAVRQPAELGRDAAPPVSAFWNGVGVRYGGMSGGLDVEQYSGIETAATGSRRGLLRHYVEETRYRCRQPGAIYANGHPIEPHAHAAPDGAAPWRMYDGRFLPSAGQPQDAPFRFRRTTDEPWGDDPGTFDAIDDQHEVRQYASTLALAFLANDPLARLYVETDEALARMTWWKGPGRAHRWPDGPRGAGSGWGRAEAWNARLVAVSQMFSPTPRKAAWLEDFARALAHMQTPSGLFGAVTGTHEKIPRDPPYHGEYWVHRSNEQCFLLLALCATANVLGRRALVRPVVARFLEGLWELAWWHGKGGVIERYAIGTTASGPTWTTRADRPKHLPAAPSYPDAFQCGSAIAHGWLYGGWFREAMLLDYTGTTSLDAARADLARLDVYATGKQMASWGPTLWLLQRRRA